MSDSGAKRKRALTRFTLRLIAGASTMLLATVGGAQQSSATAWRDLTLADIEAAYGIIARNHPAAVVAAGDSAFRRTLEAAHTAAQSRAREVASYEGWLATLRA